MTHGPEHGFNFTCFHRFARIHHGDLVADLKNKAKIVRHEEHRCSCFPAKLADQFHDACLNGHIQRCRRLIQEQKAGLGQQRHGNDYTLLLAT